MSTIINEKMADTRAVEVEAGVAPSPSHARRPQLDIPSVTWWKSPGLRHLYLMMPILFLGSTINGYDGSLLNGLQTMNQWQKYFNHPDGARLGLFTAIQNIGAVAALPFSPYAADLLGRRIGVEIGIILIFVGVIIQVVPGASAGTYVAEMYVMSIQAQADGRSIDTGTSAVGSFLDLVQTSPKAVPLF